MEKSKEVLVIFLEAWQAEDFELMFSNSQLTWKEDKKVEDLKAIFDPEAIGLKDFKIVSSTYVSPSAMKYAVDLHMASGDKVLSQVNVICEEAPFKPRAWGDWGVNPVSVMNVVQKIPKKKAPAKKPAGKSKK